jgi:N-acetylmuramoyl-L-alanine amidase
MQSLLKWMFCVAVLLFPEPAGAQTPLSKLDRVQLFGHEYVRLDDWADANGYQFKWTRKDEVVQVKTRYSTLEFEVDSRRAEINGVAVWLSVTVARKNGAAYISPLDLQTTIFPVLYPPRIVDDSRVLTVCLDPGHGGKDPGFQVGKVQEKKYALLLAEDVQKLLRDAGFKVFLTRTSDATVEKADRPVLANAKGADLFVSLHFNATASGSARGIETYCLTPPLASSTNARGEGAGTGAFPGNKQNDLNMLLAYQVQKSLVKDTQAEDRGVRRARWAVLKTTRMPAILIEGGFLSDKEEMKKITDYAHRKKMARAIADGLVAYKKLVER